MQSVPELTGELVALDLGGAWQCAQVGGETIPALVPGCVHTDLLAAGKLDEPFYRDNEDRCQWISEKDWCYTRTFDLPASLLDSARIVLRCDGLDTLAVIFINGTEIARTDNMFRVWEFDVKPQLRAGENTIAVRFESAVGYIEQRQQERKLEAWSGPHDITGRPWMRKQQCNFGWDWGPCLVTCGIWRPIHLLAYHTARLTDLRVQQEHLPAGAVELTVTATADVVTSAPLTAAVTVSLAGKTVAETRVPLAGQTATAKLTVTQPELWWPHGLGEQPLYEVQVTVLTGDETPCDTATRRIGLRTLRLDRHPDQWGESFQFVVNGVPFFAKGANWIPSDAFVTRVTRAHYADLLTSAVQANMNMLRVWGGGIYEDDAFYDLCDELGVCIWQDFMFACSPYPSFDKAFMANVRAEGIDTLRRLRHHPCIALWCGNNELEQGIRAKKSSSGQMSEKDYAKLFDLLLPELTRAQDGERDYWPCSPHTPIGDRYYHADPTCGDAHLWDVWHGRKPFEWYRTCEHRFNSEFGFQSFPEPKTVYDYTQPQDRNVTTYVMEHHQRSGIGNAVIMQYMLDWYRLPTSFDMTLWLSQILQGMAIKYAVEHWRRAMPRGMGTLYWQLNDNWPVASWSSIDYHGRWKALHFMAKQFYAPLLISGVEDLAAGTVEIHVTSDHRDAGAGIARWVLTDLAGKELVAGERAVPIAAQANTLVETLDITRPLAEAGKRNLLLWLELMVAGERVSTNLVLFARPKHLELADPGIAATVREMDGSTFAVTLSAKNPALWVWLELDGIDARCSDNFVHLRPGVPVEVLLTPASKLSCEEVEQHLRVRSLVDSYR